MSDKKIGLHSWSRDDTREFLRAELMYTGELPRINQDLIVRGYRIQKAGERFNIYRRV